MTHFSTIYERVIPRDLFNEANLLKCYGTLYLRLEPGIYSHARLEFADEDPNFFIGMDENSGDLTIDNVYLVIGEERYMLTRPLNSRDPYPLFVSYHSGEPDFEPVRVFTDDGQLTPEMVKLVMDGRNEKGAVR